MSAADGTEQSLLLTLPPELREKIYDFLLAVSPPPTVVVGARRLKPKITVPTLAIACRQLYQEVLPRFFELQKVDLYLCMDLQLRQCKKQLDHWESTNIAFGRVLFIGKDEWNDGHWGVQVRCPRSLNAAKGEFTVEATSDRGAKKGPLDATVLRGMEDRVRTLLATRQEPERLLDVQAIRDVAWTLLESAVQRTPQEQRWLETWDL